jgi:hypothetical protein
LICASKVLDMEIPFDKQTWTDFDWFGVDEEGLIGHFTTAGYKRLPPSVASSAEDLKLVTDYFENNAPIKGSHAVDENSVATALQRNWAGEENEGTYLRTFVAMAEKGLFSFDIEAHLRPGITYFRVAYPEVEITIGGLPDRVANVVSRTVLRGVRLRIQSRVPYDATMLM